METPHVPQGDDAKKSTAKYERAREIVEKRCVKHLVFQPSNRELWVVVGSEGDQLVLRQPIYCSCRDWYFRGLSQTISLCYHLLAVQLAIQRQSLETLLYDDEEHYQVLSLLIRDIQNRLFQEGGKRLQRRRLKALGDIAKVKTEA